jgi:YHS domain-containing protein
VSQQDKTTKTKFSFMLKIYYFCSDISIISKFLYLEKCKSIFPILDFFDRVTFYLAKKKPIYYFSSPAVYAKNYNEEGDEIAKNLISFFAVGSGCAFYYGRAISSSREYMEIAQQSFATYAKHFLEDDINYAHLEMPELEEKLKKLDKKTWSLREQN